MKKILTLITLSVLFIIFSADIGFCAAGKQIDANIKTKRVPEGTIIPLKMRTPAGSDISKPGDSFDMTALKDIKADDNSVVIPAGSVVRGAVETAQPAKRLYKGGVIRLYFDHIVSTSGRQVPFYGIISNNIYASYDGSLGTQTSYIDALAKTAENTKNVVVKPVLWAWDKGDDVLNGVPKYVFAPVTAVVCSPAAAVYFIGDSIADIFKKGREITVNQGDTLEVKLLKPLDMPVY